MIRPLVKLFTLFLFVFFATVTVQEAKAAATVPLTVTVNGSLVISDAANDTAAGKNPTKSVTISVTPDLGASVASGQAGFRIRTNNSTWRLTTSRTASSAGTTGIADTDVKVDIAKSAGTNASATAGAIALAFASQTNLSAIPVPPAVAADVINGSTKTSTAKDSSNAQNWFQVDTTYSIQPDFFYTPGSFTTTITYNLVSP